MKITHLIAGLSLAASLFFTPALSTAQAQKSVVGKQSSFKPSVPGGPPIKIAVYNYMPNPVTVYFVDQSGVLQNVPGATPVPPIAGTTPTYFPSFVGASLFFRNQRGGGKYKYFGGADSTPQIVLGNPPSGASNPQAKNDTSIEVPDGTAFPAPGGKGTRKKSVTNVTTVTTSTPGEAPAAPAETPDKPKPKGKRLFATDTPVHADFLRIHNAARADVGVGPLQWSEDLHKSAQGWADKIAETGRVEHRPDSAYGENIGWGTGDYTPAAAANSWLAEKAEYSPDAPTPKPPKGKKKQPQATGEESGKTAHYTQMVWGKSTMVGLGVAKTKDGRTVVVANYNPRGNIKGEKPY